MSTFDTTTATAGAFSGASTVSLVTASDDDDSLVLSSSIVRAHLVKSNSTRLRDPSSWIKRQEAAFKPPASPISLAVNHIEANLEHSGNKAGQHPLSTGNMQRHSSSESSKVKALASLFEPAKHEVARSDSENRVKTLVETFTPKTKSLQPIYVRPMDHPIPSSTKSTPSTLLDKELIKNIDQPFAAASIESTSMGSVSTIAKFFNKSSFDVTTETAQPMPGKTLAAREALLEKQVKRELVKRFSSSTSQETKMEHSPLVSPIASSSIKRSIPGALLPSEDVDLIEKKEDSEEEAIEYEPFMEEVEALAIEADSVEQYIRKIPSPETHELVGEVLLPRGARSRSSAVSLSAPPLLTPPIVPERPPSPQSDLPKAWKDFYRSVLELITNELTFVSKWHLAQRLFIEPLLIRLGAERTLRLVPLPCWDNILRFHIVLLDDLIKSLQVLWGEDFVKVQIEDLPITEMKDIIAASARKLEHFTDAMRRMEVLEHRLNETKIDKWFVNVDQVVTRHANALLFAKDFIVHYPSAVTYLETMSSKKKIFLTELENNPELEGLKFRDFLIQPIQNVCRYQLLYKAITDKAPTESLTETARITREKLSVVTTKVNEAMRVEDRKSAEEMLAKLKAHNNHKFAGRLLPKGLLFPAVSKHSSAPNDSNLDLNDVTTVPMREGLVQVMSMRANFEDSDEKATQSLTEFLVSKGKVSGLLCKNQLLLVETQRLWANPVVFHSFKFSREWSALKIEEDATAASLIHLIMESDAGQVDVALLVEESAKTGWIRDLQEVCRLVDSAKRREAAVKEQMSKRRSLPNLSVGSINDAASDLNLSF